MKHIVYHTTREACSPVRHLLKDEGIVRYMRGRHMMIGTKEVIHHLSGSWTGQLNTGQGRVSAPVGIPSRRHEPRVEKRNMCSYELCESIDEEAVVIQQGEVFTVNRSAHGILVMMGQPPRVQQLLELHIPESRWRHSMNLYEVQWTKALAVEAQGGLYLVGCRLTFGPSRYWNF